MSVSRMGSATEFSSKFGKFRAVCACALETLSKNGVSGVRIAKVARRAKVSRPWIYKYVAGSQKELLLAAVRMQSELLTRGSPGPSRGVLRRHQWVRHFMEGVEEILQDAEAHPEIVEVYFRFKGDPGFLGQEIRNLERDYVYKKDAPMLKSVFRLTQEEARDLSKLLVAFRMGVAHYWSTETRRSPAQRRRLKRSIRNWVLKAVSY